MLSPLCDPRAEAVVERLHAQGDRQFKFLLRHYLLNVIPKRLIGRKYSYPDQDFMRDKLVPLDRDKCYLCYLLCRAINARQIVEFAMSLGVSTIYLAAAVRDNVRANGGSGVVIGTEIEPTKAALAKSNFVEAGLAEFIECAKGMRERLSKIRADQWTFSCSTAGSLWRAPSWNLSRPSCARVQSSYAITQLNFVANTESILIMCDIPRTVFGRWLYLTRQDWSFL